MQGVKVDGLGGKVNHPHERNPLINFYAGFQHANYPLRGDEEGVDIIHRIRTIVPGLPRMDLPEVDIGHEQVF